MCTQEELNTLQERLQEELDTWVKNRTTVKLQEVKKFNPKDFITGDFGNKGESYK